MDRKEWLSSVKVGDQVIVRYGFGIIRNIQNIQTITRITKTQIVVGENRYRKSTGVGIGSGGRLSIGEATPDGVATIKAQKKRSALTEWFNELRVRNLSIEQLEAMKAAYEGA